MNQKMARVVMLLSVVACTERIANAQFEFEVMDGFAANTGANQKQQYEQHLDLRIDELHRVCELNDAQLRKLKTASKGAVIHAMNDWKKKQQAVRNRGIRMFNAIRLQPPVAVAAEAVEAVPAPAAEAVPAPAEDAADKPVKVEPEPAEEKPADDDNDDPFADALPVPAMAAQGFRIVAPAINQAVNLDSMSPFGGAAVEQQEIWQHTVDTVLTAEQKTKLSEAVAARMAYFRESHVRNQVALLDHSLRLSPTQREQVAKIIDGLAADADENSDARTIPIFWTGTLLTAEHLKDVLTATQLNIFRQRNPVRVLPGAQILAPPVIVN